MTEVGPRLARYSVKFSVKYEGGPNDLCCVHHEAEKNTKQGSFPLKYVKVARLGPGSSVPGKTGRHSLMDDPSEKTGVYRPVDPLNLR